MHGVRRPSSRRRRVRLAGVVAALSIGAAVVPSVASAEWTWYRAGGLCAGCRDADVTRTALTASFTQGDYNRYIQAGAHQPGSWDLYGGYVQGWIEACHNYSGQNIGAMVRNPHTVSQSDVWAHAGWVKNGIGSYC